MKQLSLMLLIATLLSGCASFYARQPDVTDQVNSWIERNQYDKALNTIYQIAPDHPDYLALTNAIPLIEQQREQYVQAVLKKAKAFEPNQDWVQAITVIESGLEALPNAPELEAQRFYYETKRLDRINMDQAAILIARAQYIISARPHQESKLYNSQNRFFAQQQFNDFLEEASRVSRELYAIGQRYWQEKKLVQARQALALSVQTAPNQMSQELLAEIHILEKDRRAQARAESKIQASDQLPELKASFYEQLDAQDFLGAQKIINEVKTMDPTSGHELEATLNERKANRVRELTTSGNTLYNAGYIQEATLRWQQVLELDPDNNLVRQQLDRAEVFLTNLQRWESSPE
jgi:heterodisulfide reductase subunit C